MKRVNKATKPKHTTSQIYAIDQGIQITNDPLSNEVEHLTANSRGQFDYSNLPDEFIQYRDQAEYSMIHPHLQQRQSLRQSIEQPPQNYMAPSHSGILNSPNPQVSPLLNTYLIFETCINTRSMKYLMLIV